MLDFVSEHLPSAPARVLEVGCGDGALAADVAARGYRVVAIDPRAPDGEIFERTRLEEFETDEPFDAVIASKSLHHIHSLPAAADKLAALLEPEGLIIVSEYGWDLIDERTAAWYLGERSARDRDGEQNSVEQFLAEWHRKLADLHGYQAIRRELDQRFTSRRFEWIPFLHTQLGEPSAEAEERRLIEAGEITALGFRYVGEAR